MVTLLPQHGQRCLAASPYRVGLWESAACCAAQRPAALRSTPSEAAAWRSFRPDSSLKRDRDYLRIPVEAPQGLEILVPLDNGAGHSDDTAVKQHDFGYVLKAMLGVAKGCMQRLHYAHKEFQYFDLNAGPGVVGGIEGSPLVFVRTAAAVGLPFRAYFFERDETSIARLSAALRDLCDEVGVDARRLHIIPGEHERTVPWYVEQHLAELPERWVYGLGYGDGNGKNDVPIAAMEALARRFRNLDLLLNVNATVYKRLRGANPDAGFLLDDLAGIGKDRRLIREPVGIHQWTMVFMTNWDRPPQFQSAGFHRIESSEGRRIVQDVNFSKREVSGIAAPFVAPRPTAPMPSTSGIPVSSPFAPSLSSDAAASASAAGNGKPPSPIT